MKRNYITPEIEACEIFTERGFAVSDNLNENVDLNFEEDNEFA